MPHNRLLFYEQNKRTEKESNVLAKSGFIRIVEACEAESGKIERVEALREVLKKMPDWDFSVELIRHCLDNVVAIPKNNECELIPFLDLIGQSIGKAAVAHAAQCSECTPSDYALRTLITIILHYVFHKIDSGDLAGILVISKEENSAPQEDEKNSCDSRDLLRHRLSTMRPENFGKC